MLHPLSLGKKEIQSPIPQFSHDPNFIAFRSWTTILSLKGILPDENPADSHVLFLNENADACESERVAVRGSFCLRNPTQFAHLNISFVCERSGREVFFVRELPAGRFLHLKFLQEGLYTLYYSPAFSPVTLRRNIQTFIPAPSSEPVQRNFHPSLQNCHPKSVFNTSFSHKLKTPIAKPTFNSPFLDYKG